MGALVDAEQAERLRRTKWTGPGGANRLAEEIYAIWTSKAPYEGDPINIVQQGDTPVINITIDGGNPITQGPPITEPIPAGDPPEPLSTGGGQPGTPGDTIIVVNPTPTTPSFPIPGWAIITAYVSAYEYTCAIYLGDPTNVASIGTLNCHQREAHVDDSIPIGTEVMVLLSTTVVNGQLQITGGTIQVPVFLEVP